MALQSLFSFIQRFLQKSFCLKNVTQVCVQSVSGSKTSHDSVKTVNRSRESPLKLEAFINTIDFEMIAHYVASFVRRRKRKICWENEKLSSRKVKTDKLTASRTVNEEQTGGASLAFERHWMKPSNVLRQKSSEKTDTETSLVPKSFFSFLTVFSRWWWWWWWRRWRWFPTEDFSVQKEMNVCLSAFSRDNDSSMSWLSSVRVRHMKCRQQSI